MRISTWTSEQVSDEAFEYNFIHDWYTLGAKTMIMPYRISYALRERDGLQSKIKLKKGRVVYKSYGPLAAVQKKLVPLLHALDKKYTPAEVLSYRKGVDPKQDLIATCTGHKYTVHFDIRKYFDTISLRHITKALEGCGMTHNGAKLVARLSCVSPRVSGRKVTSLQQGSAVSPLISNLVGAMMFDRPLQEWWENKAKEVPGLEYKYRRYCDNVLVCVDGNITIELLNEYKAFAKQLMKDCGFKTHDWATIPTYHPKRNQKFLGIVLNEKARVEKELFDRLAAILFNCCRLGRIGQAGRYAKVADISTHDAAHTEIVQNDVRADWSGSVHYGDMLRNVEYISEERFKAVIRGNISYIKGVSPEQYTKLHKLWTACELLESVRKSDQQLLNKQYGGLQDSVLSAVKRYRKREETIDDYIGNIQRAVSELSSAA